jgi:hypothetical protein
VGILAARGGDGWSARRRQFGQRCHVGEPGRVDLGEERADRRALFVNDGGAGNRNGPLACEIGLGGTAALGRLQRKRSTLIFFILNPFSN